LFPRFAGPIQLHPIYSLAGIHAEFSAHAAARIDFQLQPTTSAPLTLHRRPAIPDVPQGIRMSQLMLMGTNGQIAQQNMGTN
jgi:hypothetical protein